MIRSDDPSSQAASIELTPIIDMVFLLLIFFLVATTFHQTEREMQIALPHATNAGPISASLRELVINVDESGAMIVNGARMSGEEIDGLVRQLIESNPQQKVTIRGDRDTRYANVVVALDVCKGAGIQEPYLDTVMEN